MPLKLKGSFALLGASLTIALFGILVHLLKPMFGTATQTTLRALLAALIMAGIMALFLKRRPRPLPKRDWAKTAIVGVCGSVTLGLFSLVALHDKAASATFLVFTGSILTSLIGGVVFLHERITPIRVAAAVLVLSGLLLYAHGFSYKGILTVAGLAGGMSDGIANIVRKRLRHADRPTVVMYQYGIGAMVAGLFVLLIHERPILEVQVLPMLIMVVFALLALGLGTLLLYGYAHVDVQTGAVLSSMQVFFALILGAAFLRQIPTLNEIIGCLLISIGSCLAVGEIRQLALSLERLLRWRRRAGAETE
jgi:drug/metabolite transporter (DMT)-like permease